MGRFNHFRVIGGEDRSIYWTPDTGAQPIQGQMRRYWANQNWELGPLGYPVTGQFQPEFATSGLRQNFQGAYLTSGTFSATKKAYPTPEHSYGLVVFKCKWSNSNREPFTGIAHARKVVSILERATRKPAS